MTPMERFIMMLAYSEAGKFHQAITALVGCSQTPSLISMIQ